MDIRVVLGIIGAVCAIIVIARLFMFVFNLTLGNYGLLTIIAVLLTVIVVIVLMIKKFLREQDWHAN